MPRRSGTTTVRPATSCAASGCTCLVSPNRVQQHHRGSLPPPHMDDGVAGWMLSGATPRNAADDGSGR